MQNFISEGSLSPEDTTNRRISDHGFDEWTKQSTSPEASLGTISGPVTPQAPPRIRRRNRMITSCLECRRRKLKCDKSHPCANCTKFARDCVFLAPALDSASQLRLTEIKEKMGSLERVLERDVAMNAARKDGKRNPYADDQEIDFAPEPEDEKHLEPTPLSVVDALYDDDGGDDDLEDLGVQLGKLRLTDRLGGFFRPKMSEELSATLRNGPAGDKQQDKSSSAPQIQPPLKQPPFVPGLSFFAPTPKLFLNNSRSHSTGGGTTVMDYLPSKTAADRLLMQYWYAIHPITRVVHRPSFERRYALFWNELSDGIEPIGSLQAVVFAMMFSGIVSMTDEAVMQYFGVTKRAMEENFLTGTEIALTRANLMRTTKVETLQAFVMYMIPLSRDYVSRAQSAVCGLAIRLAECMGLHRDGTVYNLNPTETHVRRLVWYQLCFLDIRTSEVQGPRPGIRKEDFDTKLPLNVNDIELESSDRPPESARRWTEMTFSLMRMECTEMHRLIWIERARLEKKQTSLTTVLGKVEAFRKALENKYFSVVDTSVPLQEYARQCMFILTNRMHIMILHRYYAGVSTKIPDRLRQIIIGSGIELLLAAISLETNPALEPWIWYCGAYQQYHTSLLLLAEVYSHPMRREADRIWQILDYVFETPPEDLTLDRDTKARRIIVSIRDRLGAYNEARKVKSPSGMSEFLGRDRNGPRYPRREWWQGAQDPRVKLEPNEDQELAEREQIGRDQAREQAAVTNFYLQTQQQQYLQQQQQQLQLQQQGMNGGQQAYRGGQQAISGSSQVMNGSPQVMNGSPQPMNGGHRSISNAEQTMNSNQHYMGMGQQQMNMSQHHIPPMLQPQVFDLTGFDTLPVLASTTPSVAASPMDALSVSHEPGGGPNHEGTPEIDWEEWDKLFPPDINNGQLDVSPGYGSFQ